MGSGKREAVQDRSDANRDNGGPAGGHLSGFMGATNGIARFEGGDYQSVSSKVQASVVMCGPMVFPAQGAR